MTEILRWKGKEKSDYEQLCEEVRKTEYEMEHVREQLNHATDPDLVDSVIYHLKSLEKRYLFLRKELKQMKAG
ncbi:DUF2508 family protein [Salinithrix halophila]|uniref:DUF2508 family protein n=1 Tax=Salinithrix halophila TaxID=1485204 RepID=A0ABV8JKH7_9BACL